MMNRRDFLTALLGSAAVIPLLSSVELSATPTKVIPPSDQPPFLTDYEAVHRRALELFSDAQDALGLPTKFITSDLAKFGERLPSGVIVKHQLSVMCDMSRQECLGPAMKSLAERCAQVGLDSFVRMGTDLPGTEYAASRCGLRMVVQYQAQMDMNVVRFDVLGGVSDYGERAAQRYRNDGLKRSIRRRLGSYPSAFRLSA